MKVPHRGCSGGRKKERERGAEGMKAGWEMRDGHVLIFFSRVDFQVKIFVGKKDSKNETVCRPIYKNTSPCPFLVLMLGYSVVLSSV